MPGMRGMGLGAVLLLMAAAMPGQQRRGAAAEDAEKIPGQTFRDARSGVSFDVPGGWLLTKKDHEVSTFRLDARRTRRKTGLRAVANIGFNPFPASTFSGAFVYFSVTPQSTRAACVRQAAGKTRLPSEDRAGIKFARGHDEHYRICVDAKDEVYTAFRRGSCLRFDLAMNKFCGGEVSGVREMTAEQMDDVVDRMVGILETVKVGKGGW